MKAIIWNPLPVNQPPLIGPQRGYCRLCQELTKAVAVIQMQPEFNPTLKLDNLLKMKLIFLKLETYIDNLGNQGAYQGQFMMELFQTGAGITHANREIFSDEVR